MYTINIHILTFCYDTLNNVHHDLFVGLCWSLGFDFLYRFTSFNLINKIKYFLQSENMGILWDLPMGMLGNRMIL